MTVTEPYESVGLLYRVLNALRRQRVTEPYESVGLMYTTAVQDLPSSVTEPYESVGLLYANEDVASSDVSQNPTNL